MVLLLLALFRLLLRDIVGDVEGVLAEACMCSGDDGDDASSTLTSPLSSFGCHSKPPQFLEVSCGDAGNGSPLGSGSPLAARAGSRGANGGGGNFAIFNAGFSIGIEGGGGSLRNTLFEPKWVR